MKEIRKEMRFCGSCRYFKNEDINGDGWCIIKDSACRCDCGRERVVRGSDLRSGLIQDCGAKCPLRDCGKN